MINNIQILRFIAVALVIFAHSPLLIHFGVLPSITNLGGFGVDIFFVISGFIIPYILLGRDKSDHVRSRFEGIDFFIRRVIRIWPLYFIMTVLVLIVAYCINPGPLANNAEVANAFGSQKLDFILFVQSLTFTHPFIAPIVNVGWTLQFEFVFYSCISIFVILGAKTREHLIAFYFSSLLLAIFFLGSVISEYSSLIPPIKVIGSPLMIEFLFGLILYSIFKTHLFFNKWIAGLMFLGLIPLLFASEIHGWLPVGGGYHREILWGFVAFLLVWSALSLEAHIPPIKFLILLGDASYSMYLVHWVTLPWITLLLERYMLFEKLGIFGVVSLCLVISQSFALIVHLYVEKPITKKLKILNSHRWMFSYHKSESTLERVV